MPRYAALIYGAAEAQGQGTPEELEQVMVEYNAFGEAARGAGVITGGEALHDTSTATTVHIPAGKGGEPVFTDGPYLESKEYVAGFWIVEAPHLDVALRLAALGSRHCNRRVELRPFLRT